MAAPQLGRAQLEEKDRDDLEQIAGALGIKGIARASRDTLIGKILEETMTPEPKETTTPKTSAKSSTANSGNTGSSANTVPLGADGEPLSEWELELAEHEGTPVAPDARVRTDRSGDRGDSRGDRNDRNERGDRGDSRGGDRGFRDRNDRNFNDRGGDRNRRRRGRRRGGRDEGPQG
ncbi:MAG: hypothetical protein ACO38D_11420, partial [Ilumatobacteraceae bacterium]